MFLSLSDDMLSTNSASAGVSSPLKDHIYLMKCYLKLRAGVLKCLHMQGEKCAKLEM